MGKELLLKYKDGSGNLVFSRPEFIRASADGKITNYKPYGASELALTDISKVQYGRLGRIKQLNGMFPAGYEAGVSPPAPLFNAPLGDHLFYFEESPPQDYFQEASVITLYSGTTVSGTEPINGTNSLAPGSLGLSFLTKRAFSSYKDKFTVESFVRLPNTTAVIFLTSFGQLDNSLTSYLGITIPNSGGPNLYLPSYNTISFSELTKPAHSTDFHWFFSVDETYISFGINGVIQRIARPAWWDGIPVSFPYSVLVGLRDTYGNGWSTPSRIDNYRITFDQALYNEGSTYEVPDAEYALEQIKGYSGEITTIELLEDLVANGKASYLFDMGDVQTVGDVSTFKEVLTGTYPDATGTPPLSLSSHSSATDINISTTGGPATSRGYLESTSLTASTSPATLYFKGAGDYTFKDHMWFAFSYWINDPLGDNGGQQSIFTFQQYYAEAYANFPFALRHGASPVDGPPLLLAIDSGNDFTTDITQNCGTLSIGAWNHIIVQWSARYGSVEVWLNGVRTSVYRSFNWPTPNPHILGLQLLSAKGYGSGASTQRARGRIADLWVGKYTNGADCLLTNDEAMALYNSRLT
jgi:hypothetical protein